MTLRTDDNESLDMSPQTLLNRLELVESDLRAMRGEADESGRLATLGLMATTMAHELRNVLTPMVSYAHLAQHDPRNTELLTKALDRIVSGLRTVSEIIDSTLDFASTTSSRAIAPTANIREALDKAMLCLARDPARDGIGIEFDIAEDLEVAIRPLALQQIFMNLLVNSMRAIGRRPMQATTAAAAAVVAGSSPSTGIASGRCRSEECEAPTCHRIRITASGGRRTNEICIEFSDTGPGFSREFAQKMFQPFVSGAATDAPGGTRAAPSQAIAPGGTGLGLSICRRLVDEAGGRIEADSNPGRGATFTVHLPTPTQATPALRKAG